MDLYLNNTDTNPSIAANFNINHQLNDSNNRYVLLKCPICCCGQSVFFCQYCIRNGDFTYSKQRFSERFADKKLKYFKLKSEQMTISTQMDQIIKYKTIKDDLEFNVRTLEHSIETLRKTVDDAKQALNTSRITLANKKQSETECRDRRTKLIPKVKHIRDYLIHRKTSINTRIETRDKYNLEIKELMRQRVCELTQYIFAIEASFDDSSDRSFVANTERTPLLVNSDSIVSKNFHTNYTIVQPWIPANGDYSAFLLSATSRKEFPNRESHFSNAEFRIGAALAYVTQFINIVAYYLDIRQPKRLSYSEFYENNLTETQFVHKVAKLNTNVLYLCVSQNVSTELLHPHHTINNVLHLINANSSSTLGIRNGPIMIKNDFYELMEDSLLQDLSLMDDPDIEDCDSLGTDEELTDYDWVEPNIPDMYNWSTSGQQTSIAGGFMSTAAASVASIWRATIGR